MTTDDEPLYQMYTADILQRQKTASLGRKTKTAEYLDTLTTGMAKAMRMLWSQLPEVRLLLLRPIQGVSSRNSRCCGI